MLVKLSLSGAKKHLADYLVLFSGLMIASGIFYMFQSISSNKAFLESNAPISMVFIIFQLGAVLLGIITIVYLFYANSFLMSMRQRDYALFMMLGAKQNKIAQLIFIETVSVGVIATLLGSLVGVFLTHIVSKLLINQLDIEVIGFNPWSGKAFLITFLFFALLFLLSATLNASTIVKKPILELLNANKTPNQTQQKPIFMLLETTLGLISLAIGYYMMAHLQKFSILGIVIALITIVLGSYLIFHSILILLLNIIRQSNKICFKNLNNFTLSQLSFRIQEYTRLLSMVSIIFALALGALTVGIGFRNEIDKLTEQTTTYDLILNNAQAINQKEVDALSPTLNVTYHVKESADKIYFNKEEFNQEPLLVNEELKKKVTYTGDQLAEDVNKADHLWSLLSPEQATKEIKIINSSQFMALNENESLLQVIQVKDFLTSKNKIKSLVNENKQNTTSSTSAFSQKFDVYTTFNQMFSGLEFMGFFLGLAFLAMLASCLMFKILSGAPADVIRYDMLTKIGARKKLLQASIKKEIAVLFLAPGLLGMIHVLFGLQMFKGLLTEPYAGIWLPFTLFFVLYFIYYLVTVWLYTGIVLKEK
ncbi:MAG TPA: FtsX-like permease family protein [Candidatus Tetragenococcus pullicola]|nr:FtsX-like permease family protein [Candidatus Tetragenococcus pullicola]